MRLIVLISSATLIAVGVWLGSRATTRAQTMAFPRYDVSGDMHRPEGYRRWVFVGASLGLRYAEDGEAREEGPGTFHNVYIQPEAYEHFLERGTFPEKTILAMETYSAGSREPKSGLTSGFYEDAFIGLSAAVKDRDRFPEGWGYVSFGRPGGPMSATAKPFPKELCYDCHREHAATDNVFTQFYPILRR